MGKQEVRAYVTFWCRVQGFREEQLAFIYFEPIPRQGMNFFALTCGVDLVQVRSCCLSILSHASAIWSCLFRFLWPAKPRSTTSTT